MFRSGNPALKVFDAPQTLSGLNQGAARVMTVQGTVNAAMILVGLCAASAVTSWTMLANGGFGGSAIPVLIGSSILGLVTYLIIMFAPKTAPFVSPVYAITKGVVLGALSLIVAKQVGKGNAAATGIVFQAVLLTFGIAAALLLGYSLRIIRVGSTMKRWACAALGGVMLYFIAGILLGFAGVQVPMFYEMFGWGKTGWFGIGFSAFMLVLGSLFLVMDFQAIEEGAQSGAPKYMEWYGAWGLLVTLIWLYIEALRLLSKLRDR